MTRILKAGFFFFKKDVEYLKEIHDKWWDSCMVYGLEKSVTSKSIIFVFYVTFDVLQTDDGGVSPWNPKNHFWIIWFLFSAHFG